MGHTSVCEKLSLEVHDFNSDIEIFLAYYYHIARLPSHYAHFCSSKIPDIKVDNMIFAAEWTFSLQLELHRFNRCMLSCTNVFFTTPQIKRSRSRSSKVANEVFFFVTTCILFSQEMSKHRSCLVL